MSRDHVEVSRLTDELRWFRQLLEDASELSASEAMSLRRVLYGLAVLVKVHFAKEEEIYLPLLDARLSPVEATEMFDAMEHAERQANGTALD